MNLFFRRDDAGTLFLVRCIVALHALWIVVSRPCLPSLFTWPAAFWGRALPGTAMRYGWFASSSTEWSLWFVLIIALLVSPFQRIASLVASLLLYHFAPLEDAMIGAAGPFVHGLTVDVLALAVAAFAVDRMMWPVVLVRFSVASQYAFATVAKLRASGLGWFSATNIRDIARTFELTSIAPHPRIVIDHPAVAFTCGAGWFLLSLAVIAAPFSRRAARVTIPLLGVAHLFAAFLFGIVWLAAPLLLVFIDRHPAATSNSSSQRASE
jgi:hypothetical protein